MSVRVRLPDSRVVVVSNIPSGLSYDHVAYCAFEAAGQQSMLTRKYRVIVDGSAVARGRCVAPFEDGIEVVVAFTGQTALAT